MLIFPWNYEDQQARLCGFPPDKTWVIADFDGTISLDDGKSWEERVFHHSWSVLEYALWDDFKKIYRYLFSIFHKLEADPTLTPEKRKKILKGWWNAIFNKMKKYLREHHLDDTLIAELHLRKGMAELIRWFAGSGIPVLIFSAGVANIIEMVIERDIIRGDVWLRSQIFVIANRLVFENGIFTRIEGQTVTSLNKHPAVHTFPSEIADRTHVILLWDSLHDAQMAGDHPPENLLTVLFLNQWKHAQRERFLGASDIVVQSDMCIGWLGEFFSPLLNQTAS